MSFRCSSWPTAWFRRAVMISCLFGLLLGTTQGETTTPEVTVLLEDQGQTREFVRAPESSGHGLMLYPVGQARDNFSRRVATGRIKIRIPESYQETRVLAQLHRRARQAGISVHVSRFPLKGWFLVEPTASDKVFKLQEALKTIYEIESAELELARLHEKKLTPNDSFFPLQWHLSNTGQNGGWPGHDLNVKEVWNNWRGAGVVIGIVDDGIHGSHPDLARNVISGLSTNVNNNPFDPTSNTHGTRVAGAAAAVGNNGLGVAGVAYESRVADIRLLGEASTDAQDALAILHEMQQIQVKNNSWGALDGDGSLTGPGSLLSQALMEAVSNGRAGLGSVIIFAGGNGRAYGDDANYDGYANSPCVIAVGAVTDQGGQPAYSEPGACLAVSAPAGSGARLCSGGRQALTTTDLPGPLGINYQGSLCDLADTDYTQSFSGTSSSAALVSGVAALVLEANPNLGWRDVKEILMRSAKKVSPADPDWKTNVAAISHNHRFGAGLVNALGATELATHWLNLAPLLETSISQTNLAVDIPDNNAVGVTRTFVFTNAGFRVETVALRLIAPHDYFGDLAINVTSPSGITSRLAERHASSGPGYAGWTLTSVRHWGEPANGTWKVSIADLASGRTGKLNAAELTLLGSEPRAALEATRKGDNLETRIRVPAPGWTYAIDASEDLVNWAEIRRVRIDPSGQAGAEHDLDANSGVRKFYRARLIEHP